MGRFSYSVLVDMGITVLKIRFDRLKLRTAGSQFQPPSATFGRLILTFSHFGSKFGDWVCASLLVSLLNGHVNEIFSPYHLGLLRASNVPLSVLSLTLTHTFRSHCANVIPSIFAWAKTKFDVLVFPSIPLPVPIDSLPEFSFRLLWYSTTCSRPFFRLILQKRYRCWLWT